MTALLIATRNAHKAREIQQILPADYQCLTLNDFPGAPAVVEDGATFAENAAKKVSALADWLATSIGRARLPVLHSLGDGGCRAVKIPAPQESVRDAPSALPANPPFYLLADDSGLEVDALGGAPGVHSARFAALDAAGADNSPDHANNAKLLRLLEGVPPARRTARFRCVLALCALFPPSATGPVLFGNASVMEERKVGRAVLCPPRRARSARPTSLDRRITLFEGVCAGRIALEPAGCGGFGYDPLFIPDGCAQTFAELGDAVKNSLSHRARALQKLKDYLATPAANR